MSRFASLLAVVSIAFLGVAAGASAQPASRTALPAIGPPISDLDMENRLQSAAEANRNALGTLEFSYLSTGDFRSSMHKTNPQGLFYTAEVDGAQVKNLARSKKMKVEEAVSGQELVVKARWSRPGKRIETECRAPNDVGYRQVIFLPYGGEEGFFSCQILPRLLPDDVVAEWKDAFQPSQREAFESCATHLPRGSSDYWTCIESAGIPLPLS